MNIKQEVLPSRGAVRLRSIGLLTVLLFAVTALPSSSSQLVTMRPATASRAATGADGGQPVVAAAGSVPSVAVTASGTDWPMWRHNERRHGNNTAFAIVHPNTVDDLRQKWRQNLGGVVASSAAVVGDRVFVGSNDRALYSLDTESGAIQWRFATGGTVESSPAVSDGRVFFTSTDGRLHAVEAATGRLVWSRNDGYSSSSPLVLDAPTRSASRVYVGSATGDVVAYDYDGNLQWKYRTGGSVHSSPTMVRTSSGGQVLYVGSDDNYLYAIDVGTHQLLWRFQTDGDVTATAASDGERVFVGSRSGIMYALNGADGAHLWSYPTAGPITSSAVVSEYGLGTTGQVVFGSHDHSVYALNAESGALAWSTRFDAPVLSSPALGAGVLYIGASNSVVAIDPAQGTVMWSHATNGAVNASPSLSQEMLVIGSADKFFYVFALAPSAPNPVAAVPPTGSNPSTAPPAPPVLPPSK